MAGSKSMLRVRLLLSNRRIFLETDGLGGGAGRAGLTGSADFQHAVPSAAVLVAAHAVWLKRSRYQLRMLALFRPLRRPA